MKSKISRNTIVSYIGYLKDAFIINEANRYNVKGRKYIGSPLKYYYEDLGLRNARLGFRQVEENHLMENAVYNELLARGYAVDVGVVETRKRNSDGKQEKNPLNSVDDSFKKIVLVRDVVKVSRDEKGIVTMSVNDFMMNKSSLESC